MTLGEKEGQFLPEVFLSDSPPHTPVTYQQLALGHTGFPENITNKAEVNNINHIELILRARDGVGFPFKKHAARRRGGYLTNVWIPLGRLESEGKLGRQPKAFTTTGGTKRKPTLKPPQKKPNNPTAKSEKV